MKLPSLISAALIMAMGLSACSFGQNRNGFLGNPGTNNPRAFNAVQRVAPRGQYVQPLNLRPVPRQATPEEDLCRAQLYQNLVGQHEGTIFIAGLPQRRRIIKPASLEEFDTAESDPFVSPPFVEVIDFLPEQVIYAGSIRTIMDRFLISNDDETRLTLELGPDGYVQNVSCG